MTGSKCLYCYEELGAGEVDFHSACSLKFFGTHTPPELPFTEEQMFQLGMEVVRRQVAVPGVQAKISLDLQNGRGKPNRFTIVGLWGTYILKPPSQDYPGLPELEDLTMKLARLAGIATVPHSLIRLQSGNLAYITRRIDRRKKQKIHMEDMCQLTDRLTEYKYRGSYEQVARVIADFSAHPVLDLVNFSEQLVFSFLTGNADMHLKNFSLIHDPNVGHVLSPAYDMVPTALVVKGDSEELALTLNGKSRLTRQDFDRFFSHLKLEPRAVENLLEKFRGVLPAWEGLMGKSFLTGEMKEGYWGLIRERSLRLQ